MRTNDIQKALKPVGLLALASLCACTISGTTDPKKDRFEPPPAAEPYQPPTPEAKARKLVILHTNDEHSHLLGFSPMTEYPFDPEADGKVNPAKVAARIGKDEKTLGGMARRQYLVNKIRAESADPVLLLSAGDNTMGTVFHAAGSSGAPDYVAMGALGYDFTTLGNHEFDFGPDYLAATVRASQKMLFGGAVPILASNTYFDDVKPGGAGTDLQSLVGEGNSGAPIMPWATKRLANGLKVGFLGLMGYEAQLVAAGKGPIAFSVPQSGKKCATSADCDVGTSCTRKVCVDPLDAAGHVGAIAADAQPVVTLLREQEKVDLVVALTHLGKAEDVAVASLVSGIDVIIGGHSHDVVAPLTVTNAGGKTLIAQAGAYGTLLGQVTLSVAPNGAVSLVEEETKQLVLDGKLDTEIYAGTNLAATPPVLSPAFETALGLTGGILGPVLKGLNDALAPVLGAKLLDQVAASDHDVVGEIPFQDSNLSNLVTDASFGIVASGACLNPAAEKIIAVQANGVLRDSLRFGSPDGNGKRWTSVADIFGVLPLGASPWADSSVAAPGFPVVVFRMHPAELFVAADVGVTKGLESDSFFLSYSGMRVTFNRSFPAFDKKTFDPMSTEPGGRVTKLELGNDQAGWTTLYEYDAAKPWALRWKGIHPSTGTVTVITNLYLAGFLDAFGLSAYAADGTTKVVLPQTVMCQTMEPAPDCAGGKPALKECASLPGSVLAPSPNWKYPEVKEWGVLLKYLTSPQALGGTIPATMYAGSAPKNPRVVEVK